MTERYNISHNDMDGAGSNIVLRSRYPEMESFHVSYNAIKETLQAIDADMTVHTKTLFVTDLSFDAEALNELMRIAESRPFLNIIYIDHHPYEGEEADLFEEMKTFKNIYVKHEIGTSATKLCYQFIKSENEDLGKLVEWINAYDIYKELEDPVNFKMGWFLNSIFWEIKMSGFKSNLINSEYKIPTFFKTLYKDTITDKNEYFEKLIKQGLVVFDDDDNILLAFCDKHKSNWQQDYPDYDYYVLPYHTKGNNISVRFSHRVSDENAKKIKDDVLKYVGQNPWHISSGGHDHAFGITLDANMPKDEHLELIEGVIDEISQWNGSIHMPF